MIHSADECARRCPEYAAATERIEAEVAALYALPMHQRLARMAEILRMIHERNEEYRLRKPV